MKTSWKNKEHLCIIAAWLLVYAYDPLYMYYAEAVGQFTFNWDRIFRFWTYDTAFLILFLVHHFALIPRLLERRRSWIYAMGVLACLVAFTAFIMVLAPSSAPRGEIAGVPAEQMRHHAQNVPLLTPPDLARLLIAILMLVADVGVVAWFNQQRLRRRLLELEKQNLTQELEHLRYQINPHFFMNTLNNIHALIDIDQERAKRTIVELSGLMRYALYDGEGTLVPVGQEAEFVRLYISLMKLRYSDKVQVTCELPTNTPSQAMMPPLLLATFVENAFKHGVSYLTNSFITIKLWIDTADGRIHFMCANSRHPNAPLAHDKHHGIGLENVRKRLELQYGRDYQLTIDNHSDSLFAVELVVPA